MLGKLFYTSRRYLEWFCGSKKLATALADAVLPHPVFKHQTPLLRKLDNVDMKLQYNKIKNLQLAAKRLNGVVVYPGETFSYWRLIGKTTRKKGYLDGMNLFYGKVVPGTGGGLCQLSNLIYWMTLHTPLTVTERYRHSYDVFPDSNRTQPFGTGATCAYNYLDLQFYNGTDQPYQLQIYLTNTDLVGEWRTTNSSGRTYEVYEKEHWITHEFWGGYVRHNRIGRRIYDVDKVLLGDELVTENHAIMLYQPYLSEGINQEIADRW